MIREKMQNIQMKRVVILSIPYLIIFYLADKCFWLYRHCIGDSMIEKIGVMLMNFQLAFTNWLPSFYMQDLLGGLVTALIFRLILYYKVKNAKKFRHGEEYGSARWGNRKDIEPFEDPVFENNIILTETERLTMNSRPKAPKYARNKNVIVIGGSGSGKTRFYVKPNLMQMTDRVSYVVTDPKGKSKVVNLRRNSSDFLGFKIKVLPKGKTRYGYIAKTDMSDKAIKKVTAELKAKVINIRKHTTVGRINAYNMAVIGIQNYYCIATNIYNNLTDVNYALLPTFRTRLSCIGSTIPFAETPYEFQQKTVGIKKETKIITVGKMPLLPLTGVHHKHPINFSQDITSYTAKGRDNYCRMWKDAGKWRLSDQGAEYDQF